MTRSFFAEVRMFHAMHGGNLVAQVLRQMDIGVDSPPFLQGWTDPSQFHGCGSFAKESWYDLLPRVGQG